MWVLCGVECVSRIGSPRSRVVMWEWVSARARRYVNFTVDFFPRDNVNDEVAVIMASPHSIMDRGEQK